MEQSGQICCHILCYWLLMLWKPLSVQGNPFTQGVLQIIFQIGLNASWNGKGGKAFFCVCVRVCASARLGEWACIRKCKLPHSTHLSIVPKLFKLKSNRLIIFLNLQSSSTYVGNTLFKCPTCVLCPINTPQRTLYVFQSQIATVIDTCMEDTTRKSCEGCCW